MNHAVTILGLLGKDIVGFFAFPLWWYTKGLKQTAAFLFRVFSSGMKRLGVSVWAKNLFVPMFGQYDWEGRLISFLVRLAQIIIRSIISVLWLFMCIFVFLLWIFVPLMAVVGIFIQLQKLIIS